jgi:ABC-type sugar transport system ATPase subunit
MVEAVTVHAGADMANGDRSTAQPALELRDIGMQFAGTTVLHDVNFVLEPGVVHSIVGHNGAGKSTLMKIAVGLHKPTSGQVLIGGEPLTSADPTAVRSLGLGMVFQEKSLIPTLNGLDNLFLNAEQKSPVRTIRRKAELSEADELCNLLGISPALLKRRVSGLTTVEQELLEIAKALRLARKVLVLDEPTAPLGDHEVGMLFEVIRNIARRGIGVILITHHLSEVFEVSDKVTVLREGTITLSCPASETNVAGLVRAMLGDKEIVPASTAERRGRERAAHGETGLEVSGLQVRGKLDDITFRVMSGEIVGLAGLAGSGRSTLLKTLFGDIQRDAGEVLVFGRGFRPRHPNDAIKNGIYLIPEDRAIHGLLLTKPIVENAMLSVLGRIVSWGLLRMSRGRQRTASLMSLLGVRARGPEQVVADLSGGNQQKVVVAKVLATEPRLLLLDEPTYGVDVGAAADLAQYIRGQAEAGMAVLWASSDLRELTEVADRILVLADGVIRMSIDRTSPDFTESALIEAMQRSAERPLARTDGSKER